MAMSALYFVFLLCAGRYLPDGDHGDDRSVPLFSFCVRTCIYLTAIMAMNVLYFSFFPLFSGRYLPDGDHGDERAVLCVFLLCVQILNWRHMAIPYCFPILCADMYLPDGDHGDERAVLCVFVLCVQVLN